MPVALGGHRGRGCTDHEFFAFRDLAALPVENTRESLAEAFRAGADYVEIDAVTSADGVAFVIHNVVPGDHFFGTRKPPRPLNAMALADIQQFRTGRLGKGRIATLGDVLLGLRNAAPRATPWIVNIELKGVQGSAQPCDTDTLVASVARAVAEAEIAPARLMFSSFALNNIAAMAHRLPDAHYALLFSPRPEPRPIYANHHDEPACTYLPFTADNAAHALSLWGKAAGHGARLGYFHPEITTIRPEHIELAAKLDVGLNSWGLFEVLDGGRMALYRRIAADCAAAGVRYSIMTDYLPDLSGQI